MVGSPVIFVAVVAMLCAAAATAKPLYLQSATFEETLRPHRLALVLFKDSQNECAKCPELLAALERAAPQLEALNPPVVVGFFNTNEDNALTMKYGISQTPTFKMFRKGEELLRDFNGGTDADDIVAYLTRHAEQPSLELATLDEAQSFVPNKDGGNAKTVVFGFFKKVDYDLVQLMEAEDELRDVDFIRCVHATTDEVMGFYGHRHTFVVFNPERAEPAVWNVTEGVAVTAALEFIANNSIPLVGTYDRITKTLYNRLDRPLLRIFIDTNEER
ncbi:MAG: thioredoxin domain-containing protein, partial [Flavobacteriaceae bacterium]|nr:thioredoxin domain-containing protein [Flavobacteriaceae bacterium]